MITDTLERCCKNFSGWRPTCPSTRLARVPACAATPGEDVDRLIGALVSAHPWEHPLVEVDRVSLWMPRSPASATAPLSR
jgi:hypothetical protein